MQRHRKAVRVGPRLPFYQDAELPNPTGAPDADTHFIPADQWPEIMALATNVAVTSTESDTWGRVDIITCEIEGTPHVLAHVRTIDGTFVESGYAWHRSTLTTELLAINDHLELARAILFFGEIGVRCIFDARQKL